MRQYLTFELERRRYAVSVEHVNSVLDPQAITPLPQGSGIVTGLTNVRGNVVPVFDPRETLRKTKVDDERIDAKIVKKKAQASMVLVDGEHEDGGIVIFEVPNGTFLPFIGLQADRIGKVVNLEESDISIVPSFLPEEAARYYEGFCFIGGTRHSIINLQELASKDVLFYQNGGGPRA